MSAKIEIAAALLVVTLFGRCSKPEPVNLFSDEIADWRGEETQCEVHEVTMPEDTVRVIYGLFEPKDSPSGFLRASFELFPNANMQTLGGCIVSPGKSPKSVRVRYCPACRAIEKTWRENMLAVERKKSS